MSQDITIIGAGLAGLTTAYLLHRAGTKVRVLEARDRIGGRIFTAGPDSQPTDDGFDLGPSWFWPDTQPALARLIADLGLQAFPQNSDGDVLFHRMSREAPRRFRGAEAVPQSLRIVGGNARLVDALAAQLPPDAIRLNVTTSRINLRNGAVEIACKTDGANEIVTTGRVVLALPPRLAEATIGFSPALDPATALRWRRTPTWMAPHAKFFAIYDRAFWREDGLNGTAQSMAGPLMEIHDATTASGMAALFGFVGMPAIQRATVGEAAIAAAALAQLQRLFGDKAACPLATLFKDWATDPLTATADDPAGGSITPDPKGWVPGAWQARLVMAGSETSSVEPGYLAGAVEAAHRAAQESLQGSPLSGPEPERQAYHAMQVTGTGGLERVERPIPAPARGEVLIAVEACGICGADISDIERATGPRVPGHEVVGRLRAVGEGVSLSWQIGQRVGVGRMGGHCNDCRECRQGQFQLCPNQPIVGSSCDGGYAEMMLARATGLVSIPDDLASEEAAPLLCAGLSTYNALRKSGAEPGDLIAVLGIGGLGHMAVQYARRMGFQVVAIGRGNAIRNDALRLGAHVYVDAQAENAAERLLAMGGASAILSTIGDAATVSAIVAGLAPQGRLLLLGVGRDPLALSMGQLVGGERDVIGSITGTPYDSERALKFSVLTGAKPQIEIMPLEEAPQAYARMKSGDATFRMVLTMNR